MVNIWLINVNRTNMILYICIYPSTDCFFGGKFTGKPHDLNGKFDGFRFQFNQSIESRNQRRKMNYPLVLLRFMDVYSRRKELVFMDVFIGFINQFISWKRSYPLVMINRLRT